MQTRFKPVVVLTFFTTVLALSTTATALASADVLIVNDGHALIDTADQTRELPSNHFLDRYRNSLERLENVNVDVYNVTPSGNGPSAEEMSQYDMVVWYTLGDYEDLGKGADDDDECVTSNDCVTLTGDTQADNLSEAGGDVENVTKYLRNHNGRIFLTGHNVERDLILDSPFQTDIFRIKHGESGESPIYYEKTCNLDSCTLLEAELREVQEADINNRGKGVRNNPITRNSLFNFFINTSIEPRSERGIFGARSGTDSKNLARPVFRWSFNFGDSNDYYFIDYDGGDTIHEDEKTHSLVKTNRSGYKAVYAGFGFEAISSETKRNNLMNWTFQYLTDPRPDATAVEDATNTDFPDFTNGNVSITSACINRQIQQDEGIGKARFSHANSSIGLGPAFEDNFYRPNDNRPKKVGSKWTAVSGRQGELDRVDGDPDKEIEVTGECGFTEGVDALNLRGGTNSDKIDILVESRSIDLSSAENVNISYDISPKGDNGVCDAPESDEDLTVEYKDSSGTWKALQSHESGGNTPIGVWTNFEFEVPDDGLHSGFQIRFNYPAAQKQGQEDYDDWVIDNVEIDQPLEVRDGVWGESNETVEIQDVNATNMDLDLSSHPEGVNTTYAVQCKDNSAQGYWGNLEKDWVVVDTVDPQQPREVDLIFEETRDADASFAVRYTLDGITVDKEFRADLFRFSCDQSSWSGWREYDDTETSQIFTVNVTNSSLGCSSSDGNRTVFLQGRDFANNTIKDGGSRWTGSDWIVLDREKPSFKAIDPLNNSFITDLTDLQINATDTRPPGVDELSGLKTGNNHLFDNGTGNQSFEINKSFDPGYNTEGSRDLRAFIFDQVENMLQTFFSFTVDLTDPTIDSISPANDSALNSTINVTLSVSDAVSNVSRLALFNGTSWQNFTVEDDSTTEEIDPGWTAEGPQTLTVWINDTVNHLTRETFHYTVDESPPKFLSFDPANGSFVKSSQEVTIDIVDQFTAGIRENLFSFDLGANHTFTENQSFDPGWTTEGEHNLTIWSEDELHSFNNTFLNYTVDDTRPVLDSTSPDRSYINESTNITVSVSDAVSHVFRLALFNGTSWQNFTLDASSGSQEIDPGWTAEKEHELKIWFNDSADNIRSTSQSWVVDSTPPEFDFIIPANDSFIDAEENLTIFAQDPPLSDSNLSSAGLGLGVFNNGTGNFTFRSGTEFDPGWTSSQVHTLEVWMNDSAINTNHTTYRFKLDDEPPALTSADPSNDSAIKSTQDLTLTIEDVGPEGGVGTHFIRADNGTINLSIVSDLPFDPGWTTEEQHGLTVWKNDTLGNSNQTFLRYTVDDTPPTTTDNFTFAGWESSNKSIAVNATDAVAISLISTCIHDKGASSCSPTVTGPANVTVVVGCAQGETCTKIVRYRSNDTAGNLESVKESVNVSIDKQAPDIQFLRPEEGDTVGGIVELDSDISDAGAGVLDANYSVVNVTDPGNIQIVKSGDLNDTAPWDWNASWDSTVDDSGDYVFNITAKDTVGNLVEQNISFNVDNIGPSILIAEPSQDFYAGNIPVEVEANRPGATDLDNHSYEIFNTSNPAQIINQSTDTSIGASTHTFDFTQDVSGIGDENYTLNSTAFDVGGARSFSSTNFVLDRKAPNISITSPENASWQKDTVTVTFSASDRFTLDVCKWRFRSEPGGSWEGNFTVGCSSDIEFDTSNCDDDSQADCRVQVFGQDGSSNLNSSSVNLRVDNSDPTAQISAPSSGSWFNSDFNVTHSESDPQGLQNTSYRVEGSNWKPLGGSPLLVDISTFCPSEGENACTVTVNATNNAGSSVTASRDYSIDTSLPTITSINPVNNSNITSSTDITINFDASVAGRQTSVFNNGTGNTSFSSGQSFDPGWTTEGSHSLVVWVIDKAGNTLRNEYSYTLDDTPPKTLSISPANDTNITTEQDITVTGLDALTGVESSQFDNGEGINRTFTLNQSFDPRWTTDGDQTLNIWLEDFAGNINGTQYQYFVDGTPPVIILDSPANDSVIDIDQNLTVNATDAGVGVEGTGTFLNVDTNAVQTFTLNESFDPNWSTEGRHSFEPSVNDTLNNTGVKEFSFVVDGSAPTINSVSLNTSFVNSGDVLEIRSNVTEEFDSIDIVRAEIFNGTGDRTDTVRLTQFGSSDIFNSTFTAPTDETQNFTVNVTANDTLEHLGFDASQQFKLDVDLPNSTDSRFNVSQDPKFGETRVYRGQMIKFLANISDNVRVASAVVTLNSSFNDNSGVNHTLSLENAPVWSFAFLDTDNVGTYNLTRLYFNDSVGNTNSSANLPSFKVVNHSIAPSIGGGRFVDAGTTKDLNITVDLNRTLDAPFVRVFIPPSTPSNIQAPLYINTTSYSCDFGDGTCSMSFGQFGGQVAYVNVSTTGDNSTLSVDARVRVATPANDTNNTWRSLVADNTQPGEVQVRAPLLNITRTFCDGDADCNVTQSQEFNLTVNTTNIADAEHSGASSGVTVSVNHSGQSVDESGSVGDLASGGSKNGSVSLNITTAGTFTLTVEVFDNLSQEYRDTEPVVVEVLDSKKPNVTDTFLQDSFVNVNNTVTFEITATDNVGVDLVNITVKNASSPPNLRNYTMSLSEGSPTEGIWSLGYDDTGEKGTYNLTKLYVFDGQDNLDFRNLTDSFEVVELKANVSLSSTNVSVEEDVTIGVNVSGNVSTVSTVEANISKPRGVFETVTISRSPSSVNGFEGVYSNVTRSGNYSVNVTVTAGNTIHNATQNFSARFGKPTAEPLHGNSTHVLLPQQASPYNLTWRVVAGNGDMEKVNTSLFIANTSVVSHTGQRFREIGNVTFEEADRFVGYELSFQNTGTTLVNFSANTSRNKLANRTVRLIVNESDPDIPKITSFVETPDVVNKRQVVEIETNISDLSIVNNVTVKIVHPEPAGGFVEEPVAMEQVRRGEFVHRFNNTTDVGHYTYNLTGWDVANNSARNVSRSFNVTSNYTVSVSTAHGIYKKGDNATFNVVVTDVNGDPVDDFTLNLTLDKAGTNTTLVDAEQQDAESYVFKKSDNPTESGSPPSVYTAFAGVSKDGNTGKNTLKFNVTRLLDVEFVTPTQGDTVAPGADFEVKIEVTGPRGETISGKFSANCNTCPPEPQVKRLNALGSGRYNATFTAPTDEDSAGIQAFGSDGLGNSESQEDEQPPFISINIGTPTSGETGPGGEGGSGGGGGGGLPRFRVTRVSPAVSLPANTTEANLSVRTSENAVCRYSDQPIPDPVSFSLAQPFEFTGGRLHWSVVEAVEGTTYSYSIMCQTSSGLNETTEIVFSVEPESLTAFDLSIPEPPESWSEGVAQGEVGSRPFTVRNNGSSSLTINMSAVAGCCEGWISSREISTESILSQEVTIFGTRVESIIVDAGSERSLFMNVDVPLNTSIGSKVLELEFRTLNITRQRPVSFEVVKSPLVERVEELKSRLRQLNSRISGYRGAGINTTDLERRYEETQKKIGFLDAAIAGDDRLVLRNTIEEVEADVDSIESDLNALAFRFYVRQNWWKWLSGFGAGYVIFFLVTMVLVPYYRLRTNYLNAQQKLESAVSARKKAEKQYFRRQIDRKTFMNIMTERQDEVLELRGMKEEFEEELENLVSDRMTAENFFKTPVKAVREIGRWWEARKAEEEE